MNSCADIFLRNEMIELYPMSDTVASERRVTLFHALYTALVAGLDPNPACKSSRVFATAAQSTDTSASIVYSFFYTAKSGLPSLAFAPLQQQQVGRIWRSRLALESFSGQTARRR